MTTLNLIPVLDALGGTTATPAVFKAEARRAGRRATRVNGAEVAFATELIAIWDGTAWNTPPTLYLLPVDCYWNVKVQASGNRLEVNGILPDGRATVDFGDLVTITPDTGTVDASTVAQYQATQRFVSNQVAYVDGVAATVFNLVGSVQAQIETAAQAAQAAQEALTDLQNGQSQVGDQINAAISALIDGAPDALNTLNELAAALNDDANLAASLTAAISAAQTASLQKTANLTDLPSPATARTALGLGTAAVANATEFDPVGAAAAAQTTAIQRGNHTGTQPADTITGLAPVATSGAYSSLTGIPTVIDGNV